jgi:hypothetical protein
MSHHHDTPPLLLGVLPKSLELFAIQKPKWLEARKAAKKTRGEGFYETERAS